MHVREALHTLIERAGIAGDPFYTETDLLAALQTAFEVYYNILEIEGRAEILRRISFTATAEVSPLPADVKIIRTCRRQDNGRILERIPRQDPNFPSGDHYDFQTDSRGVRLIVPPSLVNVPLEVEYLPTTPRLTVNAPSDPREWDEIPDVLFPVSGIIQWAIGEVLAKDRDPAASLYREMAREHLQTWAASWRASRRVTVESPSSVRYIINEFLALQNQLKPDYANERHVLALIQRALEAIHRRIEPVAEKLLRRSIQVAVTNLPTTIAWPDRSISSILSVYVRNSGRWEVAVSADRLAPEYRSGIFFDISRRSDLTFEVHLWSTIASSVDRAIILGTAAAPEVQSGSAPPPIDPHLYPFSLILDYCLSEGLEDPNRASFHYQRFNSELEVFVQTLRDRLAHRDISQTSPRARAVQMIRQLLGSTQQADWATHVLEAFVDMARAEIARRLRAITQDLFVNESAHPVSERITPPPWIEIMGVYWYPAGRTSPRFVRELVHGDRHDPAFSWAFGLWDNDGQTIVISGFPGISGGEIVIRYVVMPEELAGRLDASEVESFLYPPDVLVSQAMAMILASPRAGEHSALAPTWTAIAQMKLSQHVAELSRAFRRSVRRRLPPLAVSPPWRGEL